MNAGRDNAGDAGGSAVDAALLLAGGSGSRIGLDKRLLTIGGRPLVLRALDFLRDRFPRVAVSVSADRPIDLGPAQEAVVVVPDRWPGDSPLAGLASGLRETGSPVFAMATDLPFPDGHALDRLRSAWHDDVDVCMPTVGEQFEPLFAFYHVRCLPALEDLLATGRHRIALAFPSLAVVRVPFPDASSFTNINTMDDYRRVREQVATGLRRPPGRPVEAVRSVVVAVGDPPDHRDQSEVDATAHALADEFRRLGLLVHVAGPGGRPPAESGGQPDVIVSTAAGALPDVVVRAVGDEGGGSATGQAGPLAITDAAQSSGSDVVVEDAAAAAAYLVVRLDSLRGL